MRRLPWIVALLVALGGCAPDPEGPTAPIAAERFEARNAVDVSTAKQTVVDFVSAYASSPTEGVGALANLVAGRELASWVRWLEVQNGQFVGTIDAAAEVRTVSFVASLEGEQAVGAQVGLSASVIFAYAPEDADPFERARILDGPVTLLRLDDGSYRVIDLTRDGVQMTDAIQIFEHRSRSSGDVEVVLDSLFMFEPNWQFNVIVTNGGAEPLILEPGVAGLYVEGPAGTQRLEGAFTPSLEVVPPGGQVAGLLAFPLQDSAAGRTLTLGYGIGGRSVRLDFPLDRLVNAFPPPPPTDAETVAAVTT